MSITFPEYCKLVRLFLQEESTGAVITCNSATFGLSEELADADEANPHYEELLCIPSAPAIVQLIDDTLGSGWQHVSKIFMTLEADYRNLSIDHVDEVIAVLVAAGKLIEDNDCIRLPSTKE